MAFHDDILLCGQGAGFQSVEYLTGFLKALEEFDLIPGRAMTSSGSSLTTALYYSKGLNWIENMIYTHDPEDFIDIRIDKLAKECVSMCNYFIDNTNILKLLEENMTGEATRRQQVGITRLRDFKNFLVPATPLTTTASTAIEAIMKPCMIGDELFGDSGLLNNVPTPPIQEIKKWKHIFVALAPEPVFNNKPDDPLIVYLGNLFSAISNREVAQLKESGFLELDNVTLLQTSSALDSGLLKWSTDYKFMTQSYNEAKEVLKNVKI